MCSKPITVTMLQDATLETERNGAPVVYWLPRNLSDQFRNARGVLFEWTVLELGADTAIRIVGRNSVDGKMWSYFGHAFGVDPDLFLDGQSSGIASLGRRSFVYAKGAHDFGPEVQIGVMIVTTETNPTEARLSMTATMLYEHFSAKFGEITGAAITGTAGDLGAAFDASGFDQVTAVVTWTGTPTSLVFYLEASGDDGTNYGVVAQSASLSTMTKGIVLQTESVASTMKLSYTASPGGTAATISLLGRVR